MISYTKALWVSLGPRWQAVLTSLLAPSALLVVAFMPEWVAVLFAGIWVVLVLGGVVAAALEHRRDRKRKLRSWRTIPHPVPCPHCPADDDCRFPPEAYGLDQAPDAEMWDIAGRLAEDHHARGSE